MSDSLPAGRFAPFEALATLLLPHAASGDDGAHDLAHILRVFHNAMRIQSREGGDAEIVAASVLLHDCVAVEKNSPHRKQASRLAAGKASEILLSLGWDTARVDAVAHAILTHSFSANITPETLEAKILQDADRLDSLGAVGVARTFYTAGRMGSALYDASDPVADHRELDDKAFGLDHFPAKLLKLADGFQTETGRHLAAQRHRRLEEFRDLFLDENLRIIMRVSALNIYPLKSGRGMPLQEAEIGREGLAGDRRWMITDPSGRFITQREQPQLARLLAEPQEGLLRLQMAAEILDVSHPTGDDRLDVVVWKSSVSAAVCDEMTNATLSNWLGQDVRLVFFDRQAKRMASSEWAGADSPVTFSDGYQILVTTTGSLAALNADMEKHAEAPVTMDRFRPNIVLEHDQPWEEDGWALIEIDGITLSLVKPCARCIMTTQDQQTGSREGANPMPAMGRIRMSADRRVPGPLFGWNAVPIGTGRIRVGAEAKVLELRERWPFKHR